MLIPLLYADFANQIYLLRNKRVSLATICAQKFGLEFEFDATGLSIPVQTAHTDPTNSPVFIDDALGLIYAAVLDQANTYTLLAEFVPTAPFQADPEGDLAFGNMIFQFNQFAGGFPAGSDFRVSVSPQTGDPALIPPLFLMDYQVSGAFPDPFPPPGVSSAINNAPVNWGGWCSMAMGLIRGDDGKFSFAVSMNGQDMGTEQTPSTAKPSSLVSNIVEVGIGCSGRNPSVTGNQGVGHMVRVAIYTQVDVPPGSYPFYTMPGNFPAPPWPPVPPAILQPPVPTPLPCIPCCTTAAPICDCG